MFALLLAAATAWAAPEMIPVEVYEAAKAVERDDKGIQLPLRDGGHFTLADHRGKPVVLAFWASWCGPCRAELPALAAWSKEHPEVEVVTVGVDRTREPAERFLAAVHFDLPVAFDPDGVQLGRYGVISMPTMFLFDPRGDLAWQHAGYSTKKGFTELDAALGAL